GVPLAADAQRRLEESARRGDGCACRVQQIGQCVGFRLTSENSYDGRGIDEHQVFPLSSSKKALSASSPLAGLANTLCCSGRSLSRRGSASSMRRSSFSRATFTASVLFRCLRTSSFLASRLTASLRMSSGTAALLYSRKGIIVYTRRQQAQESCPPSAHLQSLPISAWKRTWRSCFPSASVASPSNLAPTGVCDAHADRICRLLHARIRHQGSSAKYYSAP